MTYPRDQAAFAPGYSLTADDVVIILRALDKRKSRRARHASQPNHQSVMTTTAPAQHSHHLSLPNIDPCAPFPQRIILPVNVGYHWNVIDIYFTTATQAHCQQYDTNGYAYPVNDHTLALLHSHYNPAAITTLDTAEQRYTFSGQQNDNCGIIAALITDDLRHGRHDKGKPLASYAKLIEKSHIANQYERSIIDRLIQKHSDESDRDAFCQSDSGSDYTVERFTYDPNNPDHRLIYDQLTSNPELCQKLYRIIQIHPDYPSMINAFLDPEIRSATQFLFSDIANRQLRDGCSDMIAYVATQRDHQALHTDKHSSQDMPSAAHTAQPALPSAPLQFDWIDLSVLVTVFAVLACMLPVLLAAALALCTGVIVAGILSIEYLLGHTKPQTENSITPASPTAAASSSRAGQYNQTHTRQHTKASSPKRTKRRRQAQTPDRSNRKRAHHCSDEHHHRTASCTATEIATHNLPSLQTTMRTQVDSSNTPIKSGDLISKPIETSTLAPSATRPTMIPSCTWTQAGLATALLALTTACLITTGAQRFELSL